MRYKYTRFVGDDLEGIDLEALIAKLSDLLLSSGFEHPHEAGSPSDEEHSLQALHDAIIDALLNGDLLSDDVSSDCLATRPTPTRPTVARGSRS